MKSVDKFMTNNKPIQRTKLSEINDDILLLANKGYPIKQIHEFIVSEAKISVALSYLYRYIKKLQARDNHIVIDKSKATVVTAPAKITTSSPAIKADKPTDGIVAPKKSSILEKAAAFIQAQKDAGVQPKPVEEFKPRDSKIDNWNKQNE